MIKTFRDKTTEDIFHGENTRDARQIPRNLHAVARRKLDAVNAAVNLRDLRSPPGNDLKLREDLGDGYYAIRVNDQFRVAFRWNDGNAEDVWIADFH